MERKHLIRVLSLSWQVGRRRKHGIDWISGRGPCSSLAPFSDWMLLFGADLLFNCEKVAKPGGVLVRLMSAE